MSSILELESERQYRPRPKVKSLAARRGFPDRALQHASAVLLTLLVLLATLMAALLLLAGLLLPATLLATLLLTTLLLLAGLLVRILVHFTFLSNIGSKRLIDRLRPE